MSIQQVHLAVGWIAAIDPNSQIDQIGVVDRMKWEMEEALEVGISEYYIGYFGQLSTFFMVGFLNKEKQSALPALKDGEYDYEIATLLVSPLIEEALHFPLYYHAAQFILGKQRVGRVIYQVEDTNEFLKAILVHLGFCELGYSDSVYPRVWYGCRRADFLEVSVEKSKI
jgi:hypothetical protein